MEKGKTKRRGIATVQVVDETGQITHRITAFHGGKVSIENEGIFRMRDATIADIRLALDRIESGIIER
jgi:hypothetical protein